MMDGHAFFELRKACTDLLLQNFPLRSGISIGLSPRSRRSSIARKDHFRIHSGHIRIEIRIPEVFTLRRQNTTQSHRHSLSLSLARTHTHTHTSTHTLGRAHARTNFGAPNIVKCSAGCSAVFSRFARVSLQGTVGAAVKCLTCGTARISAKIQMSVGVHQRESCV